jgi:hypothetical protein
VAQNHFSDVVNQVQQTLAQPRGRLLASLTFLPSLQATAEAIE